MIFGAIYIKNITSDTARSHALKAKYKSPSRLPVAVDVSAVLVSVSVDTITLRE